MAWSSRRPSAVIAAGMIVAVIGLGGPVALAVARFGGSTPTQSLSVATVTPVPPTVTVSVCGLTVIGVLDEQVTLSWPTPAAGSNVTGFAILVNGTLTMTLGAAVTSWTDSNLLALGTVHYVVRVYYGSSKVWSADSTPAAVSYQLLGNVC